MNDEKREEEYSLLADRLQQLVKERFWDKAVEGPINRQTLFATLIYYDIIPEDQMPAARDSLLAAVKNGPSGHFNTGIFGTKYILEALSRLGLVEHVYQHCEQHNISRMGLYGSQRSYYHLGNMARKRQYLFQ
jgi:alpha-L-rhamnosidase